MNPKSLEQLKAFLQTVDKGVSRDEFLKAFRIFINALKEIREKSEGIAFESKYEVSALIEKHKEEMSVMEKGFREISSKIKAGNSERTDEAVRMFKDELKKFEKLIPDMPDIGSLEARLEHSITSIKAKIPKIPKEIEAEKVRDKLESLEGEERLDASAIKNLPEAMKESAPRPWFGSRSIEIQDDGTTVDRNPRFINFTGGTVTVSPDGVISVPLGSGSGGGVSNIDIVGTIDDSNVDFTAASEPTYLVINGATYESTGGAITWTYLAGAITLSSAVGTGGSIFGLGASSGSGGGHVIEDEGTPLTQRTKLNFVGSGVSVSDDSGDDATVVTISSSVDIIQLQVFN